MVQCCCELSCPCTQRAPELSSGCAVPYAAIPALPFLPWHGHKHTHVLPEELSVGSQLRVCLPDELHHLLHRPARGVAAAEPCAIAVPLGAWGTAHGRVTRAGSSVTHMHAAAPAAVHPLSPPRPLPHLKQCPRWTKHTLQPPDGSQLWLGALLQRSLPQPVPISAPTCSYPWSRACPAQRCCPG